MDNPDFTKVSVFRGLSDEEIHQFTKAMKAKTKNYSKGELILEAYVPNSNIGILIRGKAHIISLDRFGNEFVGHDLERGAILGITSAVLDENIVPCSIEAVTNSSVMWIPYRSLLTAGPKTGRIHGIFMKNFLESFSRKNVLMLQKIEMLSQKTMRERLTVYLLQKEKIQKTENVQVPGRVQLAKELECNRSALTREISKMQREGIIFCEENRMRLNKEKIV